MEGGNCDICFDIRDSILDVLLYDDGARLFSWSISEHGPHRRTKIREYRISKGRKISMIWKPKIRQQLISFGDHGIRLILAT